MKGKVKKILSICIITILIFMSSAQVMSYAVSMYATATRKNGYTYKAGDDPICDYSYGGDNEGDLYCMQIGAHLNYRSRGAETYTKYSLNNYMKNDPNTANVSDFESKTGAKLKEHVTQSDYYSINSKVKALKAIMWLVKNMYVITDKQDEKNFMADNITDIMNKYCNTNFKPKENANIKFDGYNAKLSDEEIRVIQQLVLWRFMGIADNTQEKVKAYGRIGNSGVYKPEDLSIINAFNTADKKNNGYALYSALCYGAIDNANNPGKFGIDYSSNGKAKVIDNSDGKVKLIDSGNHLYRFGPINVELANLKTFIARVNVSNLLSTNSVTSAYLGDANKNSIVTLNTNGSFTGDIRGKINNKSIYVYIKTKNILQENESAKITLTYKYEYKPGLTDDYDINMYWRKNGNEIRQPIIEIKKGINKWNGHTKNISGSIKNASIDVALTKEINKIFRYDPSYTSNYGYKTVFSGDRLKSIYKEEIKMDKSPITVVPGDIIRYKLTIYNQGENEAVIKQIKDYLDAAGLEYIDPTQFNKTNTDGNDYFHNNKQHQLKNRIEYREGTNCIVLNYNKEPITLAKGETKETFIECKVKSSLDQTDKEMQLFNIAAITEYGYMQNGVYVNATDTNIGIDKDSIQNNIKEGNESSNYSNLSLKLFDRINEYSSLYNIDKRLTSTNGESADYILEDDEDFELVKIGGFDLALRKFVDSIYDESGNNITIASRAPRIYSDTTTHFKEGGSTALYYHKKVPLEVKNGYRVRYRIRVYNEGYIPGYATEIVDYLPKGLELIQNNQESGATENSNNNWQINRNRCFWKNDN